MYTIAGVSESYDDVKTKEMSLREAAHSNGINSILIHTKERWLGWLIIKMG